MRRWLMRWPRGSTGCAALRNLPTLIPATPGTPIPLGCEIQSLTVRRAAPALTRRGHSRLLHRDNWYAGQAVGRGVRSQGLTSTVERNCAAPANRDAPAAFG